MLHGYLLISPVSVVHKLLLEKTHKGLITDSTTILKLRWRHQIEAFAALLVFFCWEFTGHRYIPRTKASDAELWWLLRSAPEWMVE